MRILVTWGLWFIWSHTVVQLLEARHEVAIVDNLSNSDRSVLDHIETLTSQSPVFFAYDLRDEASLEKVFTETKPEAVIHFAGLKAVGESCKDPISYYDHNIVGTIRLLEMMQKHAVKKLIFSSSATVYDAEHDQAPFSEEDRTGYTTNPYGTTKFVIEQLLQDMSQWQAFDIVSLRYFNPIGAHPSGLLGEDPADIPNNLFPYLMKVAVGEYPELRVFGDDYDTPDGSCVRDYIHVQDLATAHVAALNALVAKNINWCEMINIGTGKGTSVLEMIALVEEITKTPLSHCIVDRRDGDIAISYASVEKAKKRLSWKATLTIKDAIRDGRNYYNKNNCLH